MKTDKITEYILTLTCEDTTGIVARVTSFLAQNNGFILDSQQHADLETGQFFMRVRFHDAGGCPPLEELRQNFTAIADAFAFDWNMQTAQNKPRIIIAVSKASHCLNDLLHRWRTGSLPAEIAVSYTHLTLPTICSV